MADHTGSRDDRVGRARSITTMATVAAVVLLVLEPFVLSRLGNSSTPAVLVGILVLLALAPVMLIAAMVYLRFVQRQTFGEAVVGIAPQQRVTEAAPARLEERTGPQPHPQSEVQGGQPARSLTKERQQPVPQRPAAPAESAPPTAAPSAPVVQPSAPGTQPAAPVASPAATERPVAQQPAPAHRVQPVATPAQQPAIHFRLVLDDGETLDIAQPTVIGRQPASGTHEGETALPVNDKTRSISKVHARLTPRADGVVVEDLGSTNGTLITAANGQHTRLTIGSPVMVPVGGTVQFGQRSARVTR